MLNIICIIVILADTYGFSRCILDSYRDNRDYIYTEGEKDVFSKVIFCGAFCLLDRGLVWKVFFAFSTYIFLLIIIFSILIYFKKCNQISVSKLLKTNIIFLVFMIISALKLKF